MQCWRNVGDWLSALRAAGSILARIKYSIHSCSGSDCVHMFLNCTHDIRDMIGSTLKKNTFLRYNFCSVTWVLAFRYYYVRYWRSYITRCRPIKIANFHVWFHEFNELSLNLVSLELIIVSCVAEQKVSLIEYLYR